MGELVGGAPHGPGLSLVQRYSGQMDLPPIENHPGAPTRQERTATLVAQNDAALAALAGQGVQLDSGRFLIQYAVMLMERLVGAQVLAEVQHDHAVWVGDRLHEINQQVEAARARALLLSPNGKS